MGKKWKDIKGFEGYYQINKHGEVRSVDREITFSDGRKRKYKSRKMPQWLNPNGYMQVNLVIAHKTYTKYIHRLVAETFISNPLNVNYVNHIDGDRLNNDYTNLEWVTASENNYHMYNCNNNTRPKTDGKSKKIYSLDIIGIYPEYFTSIRDASRKTGYSCVHINRLLDTNKQTKNGLRFYTVNVEDIERVSVDKS